MSTSERVETAPAGGRIAPDPVGAGSPSAATHLHEIDLFRLLTFASVIAVHVLATATGSDNVTSDGLQLLLHVTREAFFTLTGFVLTYQALRRGRTPWRFWRRRVPLVLVPYLTWTVLYALLAIVRQPPGAPRPSVTQALARIGVDAISGTAWYHLYFLLVTLQLYLVYPALLAGLRRLGTAGHLGVLLVALAAQIGVDRVLVDPPASAFGAFLHDHGFTLLPAYVLYPVLGAVAALHSERLRAAARRPIVIAVLVVAAAAGAEVFYAGAVHGGTAPTIAASVFQPTVILWFLVAILGLYTLSVVVTEHWRPGGPAQRILARLSDRSFGIFLVHPLVLLGMLAVLGRWTGSLGSVATLGLLYVGTVAGATVAADVMRRLPGSLGLTGRARRPRAAP